MRIKKGKVRPSGSQLVLSPGTGEGLVTQQQKTGAKMAASFELRVFFQFFFISIFLRLLLSLASDFFNSKECAIGRIPLS